MKQIGREEKRAKIVETAVRLFTEKGAEKTRIQEIASMAGIGKSTFYEYFSDKADLVCFWLEQTFVEMENSFAPEVGASAREQLASIVRIACSDSYCTPDFLTMFLEFWRLAFSEKHPKALGLIKQMYQGFNAMAAGIIQAGIQSGEFREVDAEKTASAYLGGIDGLWLQYLVHGEAYDLNAHAEVYLEMFLRGIDKETRCG